MPLQETSGAASYDAFGGGVPVTINYIEDVFSSYIYTGSGTGVNRTIVNGIDLAGKGGLVWTKARTTNFANVLNSTALTFSDYLISESTAALGGGLVTMTANNNGYTMNDTNGSWNNASQDFVSWTFREQPKFFDTVTYTGTGSPRTIAHNLGSVPGCIIVKQLNGSGAWTVYHRARGATKYLILNSVEAEETFSGMWNNTEPTATEFTVGASSFVNQSGGTYVAHIYAHNAGGFGLTGTDNVITCGSYAGNGGVNPINLGFEPQFVLIKCATSNGGADPASWWMIDNSRGWLSDGNVRYLRPNSGEAELLRDRVRLTSTGFTPIVSFAPWNASGQTYIYIAIRRGPMRVPTTGSSVLALQLYTGNGSSQIVTGPTDAFQYDSLLQKGRSGNLSSYAGLGYWVSKLQKMSTAGDNSAGMGPASTAAEVDGGINTYTNTGFAIGGGSLNNSGTPYVNYWFRRAPSFFDQVNYTGNGAGQTLTHNLGVLPELIITKRRDNTSAWETAVPAPTPGRFYVGLDGATISINTTNGNGGVTSYAWEGAATTTTFIPNAIFWSANVNGGSYVSYLFASCPGVSKVGTYTGNGSSQTINCGFTTGARFILIKRTNDTGDWTLFDSARGINVVDDPALALNTNQAESTGADMVDAEPSGFIVNSAGGLNVSGGTYIFLAIA